MDKEIVVKRYEPYLMDQAERDELDREAQEAIDQMNAGGQEPNTINEVPVVKLQVNPQLDEDEETRRKNNICSALSSFVAAFHAYCELRGVSASRYCVAYGGSEIYVSEIVSGSFKEPPHEIRERRSPVLSRRKLDLLSHDEELGLVLPEKIVGVVIDLMDDRDDWPQEIRTCSAFSGPGIDV